ncbi:PepSY domain-containing protein [Enterobacteriaceae bacterium 4M9]|nr:PepSY domain-containing protein [Enterobacteriaceae bacterium 4M9]
MNPHASRAPWVELLRRLHFYVGLFIGPFIFIAAFSGTLYVATPQLENFIYRDALSLDSRGPMRSLEQQVALARQVVGQDAQLQAVRPAAEGENTRVMFADPQLKPSEARAIFIDPVSLAVKGDMTVYGTSGILPLRQWIDYLHRSLLLGDVGRNYSELAASWMWVAALGGMALWCFTRTPQSRRPVKHSQSRWHLLLGWILFAGLLLFSATGLTWSRWAGDNINQLRERMDWMTPQVKTELKGHIVMPADPHADHHGTHDNALVMPVDNALFDSVLTSARAAGLEAAKVEIRPAKDSGKAWTVTEIDRRWPTQVDAVAIDPHSMRVIDSTDFSGFPVMAKLTRWGIDFHMGVLFGLPNQLLLILFGSGLCTTIVLGYRMWWRRRPAHAPDNPLQTLIKAWLGLRLSGRVTVLVVALCLSAALPLMGLSLLLFIALDLLRWRRASQRQSVVS